MDSLSGRRLIMHEQQVPRKTKNLEQSASPPGTGRGVQTALFSSSIKIGAKYAAPWISEEYHADLGQDAFGRGSMLPASSHTNKLS